MAVVGLLLVCVVVSLTNSFQGLLEHEGGESFAASSGLGGILGCVSFIAILGLTGVSLIYYGCRTARMPA